MDENDETPSLPLQTSPDSENGNGGDNDGTPSPPLPASSESENGNGGDNYGTPSPPLPASSDSENGNGGDNDGWSQLVSNNQGGMMFNATPELLIMQILRRRVQGSLHRVPLSVLCYFRECHSENFFELPEYYRRRANLYFCRRILVAEGPAAGGEEVTPAGWTRTEGPTAIDNYYGHGRYATYQRMSSRVTVTEYRFFPQPPNNEIALYRILAREF